MPGLVTLEQIIEARARVAPVIRPTPLVGSDALSSATGRTILLKPEYRQRTGSFKIRGAFNHIARLTGVDEVVAASAGNHGQGVALAARMAGLKATIFMPTSAPLPKIEATRSYGATVRLEGDNVDEALAACRAYSTDAGVRAVPPFDDVDVIAGQGTIGLELAEDTAADVVIVPVGGGGLIAGVAAALAHKRPSMRVIGVEAAGAAAMRAAVDAGQCIELDQIATMADGIAVRNVSDLTLAHVQAYVDDIVTVGEEEISQAVLVCLERAKAVVEPAGAVAIAAALAGRIPGQGPVVALLSGGNVDPLLLTKLIEHGLTVSGRYLLVRVVLDDRPGALAELTAAVARLGLNVLEVTHHRAGVAVGVREAEVQLILETRDPQHRGEVLTQLGAEGFRVKSAW